VCVVRLPCREEHGEDWNQCSECADLGGAVAEGRCFEKTGQSAIERVDAMAISHQSRVLAHWACNHVLEQLSQWTRCSGAARLLSVDVVHGGVPAESVSAMSRMRSAELLHPHAEREAVVYP